MRNDAFKSYNCSKFEQKNYYIELTLKTHLGAADRCTVGR